MLNCNNILIDSCPGDSKLFSGQGEKAECGSIMADGRRAACGYADGSIRCEGFFILDEIYNFFNIYSTYILIICIFLEFLI